MKYYYVVGVGNETISFVQLDNCYVTSERNVVDNTIKRRLEAEWQGDILVMPNPLRTIDISEKVLAELLIGEGMIG